MVSRRILMMLSVLVFSVYAGWPALAASRADDAKDKSEQNGERQRLTLEDLFPEESLFGPAASGMAFSHDGRYAAYLYRPYIERRHGGDLWVLDTETGEIERVTSVSVMAPFQESTRNVRDDRVKKAEKELERLRKKEKEEKKSEENEQQDEEKTESERNNGDDGDDENKDEKRNDQEKADKKEQEKADDVERLLGVRHKADWVSEDDADARRAPRYAGVSSFTWSPTDNELLFISHNDVYRLRFDDDGAPGEPVRLTATRSGMQSVQYLPDGSGYTYLQGGNLMRVVFGRDLIEQIDPPLPRGESMIGYRISPNGQRLVFLSGRGENWTDHATRVRIARYRDRFMEVQEVWRQLPDNPFREREIKVYLHELGDPTTEDGNLTHVFTHKETGPRDVLHVPQWSPDSSRVAFAVFEQETGHVSIMEAGYEEPEQNAADGSADNGDGRNNDDDVEPRVRDAVTVYRFLHTGGPNTPQLIRPYFLPDSRRLTFVTEQSGFRHIHVLDPVYEHLEQITHGRHEVLPAGISPCHRLLFATASSEHAAREHIYVIDLENGRRTRLTQSEGVYTNIAVSPDGTRALARFATFGQPRELVLVENDNAEDRFLTDSHPERTLELTSAAPEFFSYRNRHGHEIHGHMFKPDDWTADDKRPLLIYVYGGPLRSNSRQVRDGAYSAPAYFFAKYMAREHGYVTVTIDPRGTSGYGAVFEKANFEQVGRPQVEDLVDGVKYLVENHGVDPDRVGIHGWSFGGFQTQMCMYLEPDVFAAGIAGAGPTEWENYNAWYATGTIGPSREGETDLAEFSLLPLAKNLKGKLLLVHGMEDSNVLFQDTIRIYSELLKQGKETKVELFLDPTGGHGLGGLVKTINRYRKYEEFLLRTLGTGEPAQPEETEEVAASPAEDDPQEADAAESQQGSESDDAVSDTRAATAALRW